MRQEGSATRRNRGVGRSPTEADFPAEQLLQQQLKGVDVIHVVPERKQGDRQIRHSRPSQGLHQHPVGAPGDVPEQRAIGSPQADQGITAINRRTQDDGLSGLTQRLDDPEKGMGRERGTVRIDQTGRLEPQIEQVGGGVEQALAKPAAPLSDTREALW